MFADKVHIIITAIKDDVVFNEYLNMHLPSKDNCTLVQNEIIKNI